MGTVSTKIEEEIEQDEVAEGSVPSTPILTPKIRSLEELDPRSPSSSVVRTPIETILMKHDSLKEAPLSVIECTPRLKYLNVDPRSPTMDFNRTPIAVITNSPDNNVAENENKRKSYVLLETNLDYIETDIDAVYLKNTPQKEADKVTEDEIKSLEEDVKSINLNLDISEKAAFENLKVLEEKGDLTVVMNNIKDFDKKLTNLIYEDAESPIVMKNDKLQVQNRTPLATRNANVDMRKKVPQLKVTDRPKKRSSLSKIPISKLSRKGRISVQCENTPPKNMRERKVKGRKSEWDADKTLII